MCAHPPSTSLPSCWRQGARPSALCCWTKGSVASSICVRVSATQMSAAAKAPPDGAGAESGAGQGRASRTLLPRLPRKFQEISTLASSGVDTVAGVFPWPGTGAEDTRA